MTCRFLTSSVAFYLAVLNLSIAIYLYRSYPQQTIVKPVTTTPREEVLQEKEGVVYDQHGGGIDRVTRSTKIELFVKKHGKSAILHKKTLSMRNIDLILNMS